MAIFHKKILNLEDEKLPSPIANSFQVWLDNELVNTVHNLEILIDTIYPNIKNLTERSFNWLGLMAIVSLKNNSVNDINKMTMENTR